MGTILVSAIITSCRRILLDPTPGVTWLDAAFLDMVNQAERAICSVKHDALTTKGAVSLVAGTHQVLPAGATGVLDAYENAVSKRRVNMANRALLDAYYRYWPAATQEADAQEWMADVRDPTRFEVSPPNDGTGSLIMLYGITPPALTAVGNAINLPDIFERCIKAFVLGEAYAENTVRQDLTKAGFYQNEWKAMLGLRTQSQVAAAQKSSAPGGE